MQALISARSQNLKPTITKVTNRKGQVYVEGKDGVLTLVGKTENPEYFETSGRTQYIPCIYNDNNWSKKEDSNPSDKPLRNTLASLSFITYNVWFAEQDQIQRAKALVELMIQYSPDVICLQEVTKPFLNVLLESSFFQENYCCSDSSGYKSITPYGVVIFTKLDLNILNFYVYPMASNMGRNAVAMELSVNNSKLILVSSHLESLDNPEFRKIQLVDTIYPILSNEEFKYAVFMGDTNFDTFSDEFENNIASSAFKDAWKTLRPSATKSESYTMVDEELVIDRVLFSENIQAKELVRIGCSPIYYEGENKGKPAFGEEIFHPKNDVEGAIVPSDHVGFYGVIELKE